MENETNGKMGATNFRWFFANGKRKMEFGFPWSANDNGGDVCCFSKRAHLC